jgi:hypothetical protein
VFKHIKLKIFPHIPSLPFTSKQTLKVESNCGKVISNFTFIILNEKSERINSGVEDPIHEYFAYESIGNDLLISSTF